MSRQRKEISRGFLGSPLIKTLCFHCRGCEFDPWFSSVSLSVVSDSLWPHGLQYARPPCPSPTPGACSNSCPLSRWCHPTISASVVPFFSCLQSFSASGSFLINWLFASGGQSIGASASVLPMKIPEWGTKIPHAPAVWPKKQKQNKQKEA